MPPKMIVITGPTATGKTKLGVALAKKVGGEVVSADSMQVYKLMDIGTAKPTADEMQGITHHMMDVVSPFEEYSVARYVEDAVKCVEDILARGRTPILVGGTGLYIESLLSGRDFAARNDELHREISERFDEIGGEKMLRELSVIDPERAEKLYANDKKRIVRAFEIYYETGKTISQHDWESQKLPPRYDACKIALSFTNRETLYHRINARVDGMMENGLYEEVLSLLNLGLDIGHTAMQAIGYKELLLVAGGKGTLAEAVDKIKMESRRYAKRQLSWLRRDEGINWIFFKDEPKNDNSLQYSTEILEKYGYNVVVDR